MHIRFVPVKKKACVNFVDFQYFRKVKMEYVHTKTRWKCVSNFSIVTICLDFSILCYSSGFAVEIQCTVSPPSNYVNICIENENGIAKY